MNDAFKIVRETADRITLRRTFKDYYGKPYTQTSHEQKLLCIGGPLNGQRKAAFQLTGKECAAYCQYNRGEYRKGGTLHKAVYIHEFEALRVSCGVSS